MRWLSTLAALVPALALAGGTTTTRTGVLHGPLATSGITPACTDTAYDSSAPLDTRITQGCVLRCGVGVFDGSDAWQCVEGDGAQVTVQNPAGCTRTTNTPLIDGSGTQRTAFTKNGGCTDPNVNAADADTAGLDAVWTGAHTFVFVGAPERTAKPITSIQLSHRDSSNAGVLVQRSSSADKQQCIWYGASSLVSVQQATANTPGSWIVASCRYDGTDDFFSRWNGNESTTNNAFTPDAPTTQPFFMGVREDGAEDVSGEMYEIRLYDRMLTAAEMTRLEALFMGAVMESRSVTVTRASAAFSLVNGKYHALGHDWPGINEDGIAFHGAVTNFWTDSLDASADTVVGTGVVTSDQDSGPFSVFNGGAEADLYTDDNAAGFEGTESPSAGTAAGDYTATAWVKAVTATSVLLTIHKDGSNSSACDFSSLDTTPAISTFAGSPTCSVVETVGDYHRLRITGNVATSASTSITSRLYVGNATSVTGTIYRSAAQIEAAAFPGRPCPEVDGGASRTCEADVVEHGSEGVPVASGSVSVEFTPANTGGGIVIDARTAGGTGWFLTHSGTAWRFDREGDIGTTAARSLIIGTTYRLCVEWDPGGARLYEDGVQVAVDTDAATVSTIASNVHLGSRSFSTALNFPGASIRSVRYGRGGCP